MIASALAGVLVGAIFGFVVSVLVLLMRQSRNAKLVARGEPPIRDAIRPPFVLPCAVLGGVVTMIAARWLPLTIALLWAIALPALLMLIAAVLIRRQLKTPSSPPQHG